jgi:hypothetical protein
MPRDLARCEAHRRRIQRNSRFLNRSPTHPAAALWPYARLTGSRSRGSWGSPRDRRAAPKFMTGIRGAFCRYWVHRLASRADVANPTWLYLFCGGSRSGSPQPKNNMTMSRSTFSAWPELRRHSDRPISIIPVSR